MSETYTCTVMKDFVEISDINKISSSTIPHSEFYALVPRRQRDKISYSTQLACALWQYCQINKRVVSHHADPQNTPLLILNRYANWDFVSEMMCSDIDSTLQRVNSYVATSWFPASLQGFLTIEYGNTAEALTIATSSIKIQAAAIESLFLRDFTNMKIGCVIVGTFESIPAKINAHSIVNSKPATFGALSLISLEDTEDEIITTLSTHQELYRHVKI